MLSQGLQEPCYYDVLCGGDQEVLTRVEVTCLSVHSQELSGGLQLNMENKNPP